MIDRILLFSIQNRLLMVMLVFLLVGLGVYAALQLPIDAIPDITPNQVQINTVVPALSPLEVERFVTFPIEVALRSLPRKQEIRSLSKFGLSQVTVFFDDRTDIYWARQQVFGAAFGSQSGVAGWRPTPDGAHLHRLGRNLSVHGGKRWAMGEPLFPDRPQDDFGLANQTPTAFGGRRH